MFICIFACMKFQGVDSVKHFLSIFREAIRGEERDYTEGSIKLAIFMLAIPMILELSLESVFALVDMYFVGKLGKNAIAVVAYTESLITIIYSIAIGLSTAATAIIEHDFDSVGSLNHVVVRQDVATGADDHAAAQSCLGLAVPIPKKEAEPGVAGVGAFLGGFARVDAHDSGRRFLSREPEASGRHCTSRRRRRLHQRNRCQACRAPIQPVRLQGGDNEPGCEQHGHRLREDQPGATHRDFESIKRRTTRAQFRTG